MSVNTSTLKMNQFISDLSDYELNFMSSIGKIHKHRNQFLSWKIEVHHLKHKIRLKENIKAFSVQSMVLVLVILIHSEQNLNFLSISAENNTRKYENICSYEWTVMLATLINPKSNFICIMPSHIFILYIK